MKPDLRNLFMKWLTRDRVVPIIAAKRLLTYGNWYDGWIAFLPIIRQQQEQACKPLLASLFVGDPICL
jgi:hypothetical protein